MVPVATLVKLRPINGSETASRYNLNSIAKCNCKPGFSLCAAIQVQEVADTKLPKGYTIEFSGLTKEEITSSGQSAVIFD
jgi:HAE1 family hydrophobic/amphiphilic exporter-1